MQPAYNPLPAFSYARYLAAKETLDERSLNRRVWDTFVAMLQKKDGETLRILEVGGGIGATFRRIASVQLKTDLIYTLLDIEEENLSYFKTHVNGWLNALGYEQLEYEQLGYEQTGYEPLPADALSWRHANGHGIVVKLRHVDVHQFIEEVQNARVWDAVVAQAFLDLFNIETFLPRLFRLLRSNGIFYFPINFDGITSFLPSIEPETDILVESIYHKSMDARAAMPADKGRSQSGRHLLSVMLKLDVKIKAVGSSDWVVYPEDGHYKGDEQYFLQQIIAFVRQELKKSNDIEPNVATEWVSKRTDQLFKGELIYLAHQIDLVGELG